MIGQPYPVNIGKQWHRGRTEHLESDGFSTILDHVEYILVEHVCGNEMVSKSQPPLVIVSDISIKSTKFLGWFIVNNPMLVIPGHYVRASSCRRP